MLLDPNLEIFRGVPGAFKTPFASSDSKLSEKYQSIAKAAGDPSGLVSIGERLLCQQQAQAWQSGLALVNFAKATVVGDILADSLPNVAWVSKSGPAGLFAKVAFPQSTDPDELAGALARVALDIAVAAISSVPIVGQILGAVVQVAMFLYRIFSAPKEAEPELLLPWSAYSSLVDEDLVNDFLLRGFGQGVEWTPIWLPPYDILPWELHKAERDGKEYKGGQVWAPLKGGAIPYAEGQLGCIPNTIRVAGHLQRLPGSAPVDRLRRLWYDHGDIGWGGLVTNVGDFFPSTGQVAGGMWKQAERAGSPDMYKVDARAIKSAWAEYFGQFFESGFSLYKSDASVGELLAPYICTKTKDIRLGIPNLMRPHPAPFVTPAIFKQGPASRETWNDCLFIEEDLPRNLPAWPHDRWDTKDARLPAQHPDLNFRAPHYVDADGYAVTHEDFWRAVKNPNGIGGATHSTPEHAAPKGYRCVQWPTGEERLTGYQRPDDAIIAPACDHMIKMQLRCLDSTLVSAYVRPDPVDGKEAHGAFRNNKALHDRCIAVRKLLLAHEARYRVNLKDAEDADPTFAEKLRESGVNNSPSQMSKHLGRLAPLPSDDGTPLPTPPAPAGGIAFDEISAPAPRESKVWKAALAIGGGTAVAGAAYYWVRGRHSDAR